MNKLLIRDVGRFVSYMDGCIEWGTKSKRDIRGKKRRAKLVHMAYQLHRNGVITKEQAEDYEEIINARHDVEVCVRWDPATIQTPFLDSLRTAKQHNGPMEWGTARTVDE